MANPYFNAGYYLAHNPDVAQALAGLPQDQQDALAEAHYDFYGAAEGRSPNGWFDPLAYLEANPDLVAAGVTPAMALDHFAQYGVYEGRLFNTNVALDPANFTALDYAAANPDVAAAFGIVDPDALTPFQVGELLAHYLQYGAGEDRGGAGDVFTDAIEAAMDGGQGTDSGDAGSVDGGTDGGPTGGDLTFDGPNPNDAAHAPAVFTGTTGDDHFVWNDAGADSLAADPSMTTSVASVDGLGGDDTLSIHVAADMNTLAVHMTSVEHLEIDASVASGFVRVAVDGTGIQSLDVDGVDDGVIMYTGPSVDQATVANGGALLGFTDATGVADALDLSLSATAGSVTLQGIETANVTTAADESRIHATDVQGSSFTLNLAGGSAGADGVAYLSVEPDASNADGVTAVTIDASAYAGNLMTLQVDLTSSVASANAAITTGSGDDTISVDANAGQTVTVDTGAGDDQILASDGIDLMTGGEGADTFIFGPSSLSGGSTALVHLDDAEQITAVDTIEDFSNVPGEHLVLGGLTAIGSVGASVGVVTDGVLAFDADFLESKTLTQVTTTLDAQAGLNASGQGVLFNFEGDAYLFVQGGAPGIGDDGLVRLTGVDADHLQVDVSGGPDGVVAFQGP